MLSLWLADCDHCIQACIAGQSNAVYVCHTVHTQLSVRKQQMRQSEHQGNHLGYPSCLSYHYTALSSDSRHVCDAFFHDCRSTSQASASSKQASQSTAEADDARRRFGNAKSISSSMFDDNANKANDYEKQAMLSKFSVSQPAMLSA